MTIDLFYISKDRASSKKLTEQHAEHLVLLSDVSTKELLAGLGVCCECLLILEVNWGSIGTPGIQQVNNINVDASQCLHAIMSK